MKGWISKRKLIRDSHGGQTSKAALSKNKRHTGAMRGLCVNPGCPGCESRLSRVRIQAVQGVNQAVQGVNPGLHLPAHLGKVI